MLKHIPGPHLRFKPRSRSNGNNADEASGYTKELGVALYKAAGIDGISVVTECADDTCHWYLWTVFRDGDIALYGGVSENLTLPLELGDYVSITPEKGDNG